MLALNLINAFLRQYPALCRELSGYNGIVAGIRAGSLNITGRLDENGLFAPTRRRPDTVLVLHDDVLPKILQGKMPDWNDAAVEGDIAIGMNLLLRLAPLRHAPPQFDAHRLLDAHTAENLAGKAALIGQALQGAAKKLRVQAASGRTPPQDAAEQLAQCTCRLDELQDELADTVRRVAALERRMRKKDS